MISLSPITYSTYFDEYFVSLKEYSCHVNIIYFSTWMEYSYLRGKYLVYVARIFFNDFLLLTKIQLIVHKLTTHTIAMLV
jgi:hypothetical protein